MKTILTLAALLMTSTAPAVLAQNVQRPDMATTFTGPAELQVGVAGRYTLSLRNNGSAAANQVRASLVLPAGVELDTRPGINQSTVAFVPAGCSYSAGIRRLTCSYPSFAVGETRTTAIDLRMPGSPTLLQLTASAAVTQGTAENNLANNSATANTMVATFLPEITFPTNSARMWICMGRTQLLECPLNAGTPMPLDANGQMLNAGVVRVAATAPTGSGQLTLRLYDAYSSLIATYSLAPYSSRCYQGPAVYHTLNATYEARVCY